MKNIQIVIEVSSRDFSFETDIIGQTLSRLMCLVIFFSKRNQECNIQR